MNGITPQARTWQITERLFQPSKLHHTETIFTVGNGYMGLRGTFEEDYPKQLISTLIHGVFDHAPGELVPELVNLPNPLPISIQVDGEPFGLDKGLVLGTARVLDLKTAVYSRGVTWRNSSGTIVQILFERFASLAMEHVLAQRVSVRALNRPCTITLTASLDATQTNRGVPHWETLQTDHAHDRWIYADGDTAQSHYRVAVVSGLVSPSPVTRIAGLPNQPAVRTEFRLERDQAVTCDKLTAIHSSRDAANPLAAALETLETAERHGWESLLASHQAEWAAYWHGSDVQIEGDEISQRAIRFAMYHVLIAAPRHDEHASIGAKTLSGPGYNGHVFWDTELFMVPFLIVTQPELARNLLMYRYHNLPGARNKARAGGYEGAMFPWESTDTGEETTPDWTLPQLDGSRIRIWTGEIEQHISTDIAYAVMEYWNWTRDDRFFASYGAEIVLDTAVFWGSRVEYNAANDRFELSHQIGPDEYHEDVKNPVFTNRMIRWHLQTALRVRDWLRENYPAEADTLLNRLRITDERLAHWRKIIDKLVVLYDAERGIFVQFEGFFNLEPLNLPLWQPRIANMDWIMGRELTQRTRVIKQADVVALIALLGNQFGSMEDALRNWKFYYPITDHGSSLSPSMHAWVGARLGLLDEAYEMLMYAANMDLEDAKGNVHDGIHAAAAGGLWEAVIFGFAGVKLDENGDLIVDPHLPDNWRSVTFRLCIHGKQRTIRLTNDAHPEPRQPG